MTTVAGYTRTLDAKKWESLRSQLPESVSSRVVRYKAEIDTRQLKNLQELDPGTYNIVAEAITTKPKKTAVKCQRLEIH